MTARRVDSAVVVGGVAGWALSLAPGQLPRPALLIAVAGAALTLLGMTIGGLVATVRSRCRQASPELLAGAAVVVGALLVGALWWQTQVCDDLGSPGPGLGWAAAAGGVPLAAACAILLVSPRVWAIGALVTAFVAGPAAHADAAPTIPDDPHLTYSRLTGDPFDVRARALVDRWTVSDGPGQHAVVVAVPTGSGWVDAAAVEGFTAHFGGSVRFLAMQYSDVPSWQAYVRSPDRAGESAIAVLRALRERTSTMSDPPRIYLYGQSLGAIGADAARVWADDTGVDLAGTVLSGAPAGSVQSLPACARRVNIANATDPVTRFQTSLLWQAPDSETGDRSIGTTPSIRAPWTPVTSFVGTALDLTVSLNGPVGTGHHYGVEQGLAVARMPDGCQAGSQTTGPRAAS